MAFGADDCQTAGILDFLGEFDVGTASGHVGGDGHGAGASGQGHYLCFLLVELGVEHLGVDVAHLEHAVEELGDFNRGGTHEHGASGLAQTHDFVDYGCVFLFLGLVDAVVHILARHGAVGGYGHHVEFVYIPELARLGLGGTGHTGELVVHSEVVLEGDGGEGLCGGLYLYILLGFDGLVEPVAVTASLHDTTGLLVNDFDFSVVNHIFVVFLEEGVGLEELVYGVYALRFEGIVGHGLVLELLALGEVGDMLQLREAGGDVGEHEELRVLVAVGEHIETFVGELDGAVLLVDYEVERVGDLGHFA